MIRTVAVVAAVVVAIVVLNYRAPEDPVREVDARAVAERAATVAPFPVLLPEQVGWRPTAARYEPTQESAGAPVWFAGGVFSAEGPFAGVVQSQQTTQAFIAEQTAEGRKVGASVVGGESWQRYEAEGDRSLVLADDAGVTITTGSGSWSELERFTASLEPVPPAG